MSLEGKQREVTLLCAYVHDITTVNIVLLSSNPVMKELTNEESAQTYLGYMLVNIKSSLQQA